MARVTSQGYQPLQPPGLSEEVAECKRKRARGEQVAERANLRESRAAQQRDAADEGRLDPCGSIVVGTVIVNQGKVVRPSQLIASVGQTVA